MDFNCEKNTFAPILGFDTILKNGITISISTKHMAITMMDEFKDKSFEELRLENYARKSSFSNNDQDFSTFKKNSMDDAVTNENNQLNVIKDLVDELANTLSKVMLKVIQTALNNSTQSIANQTQSNSFPSTSIKITPSFIHSQKHDPLSNFPSAFNTTPMMSTEPSTNVPNSFKFNCAPSTNNVSFAPTNKSYFHTPMVINQPPTFDPVQSNKSFFSFPNTNSNVSSPTFTWSSTSFTKSIFAPKQSTSSKTSTTDTASSIFQSAAKTSSFSNSPEFILDPSTSVAFLVNKKSSTQPKPSTKQPTSSNHSWYVSPGTTNVYNKFNSPIKNPFTKSTTTPAAFNSSGPSSNFNTNAKTSTDFLKLNLNVENRNSFLTQPSSPDSSDLTLTNGIYVHKPFGKYKSKETGEIKELNADEFVSSIINCTKTLENIAFKTHRHKLIGICEKYNTHKTNILKSTFLQLQVMKSRFKSYEKFAFINESARFLNATIQDNILYGNTFNPQLYNSAIVLCRLTDDINSLSYGDSTQVGEIGIELSDAQKQKIALARAYYNNQDVYFLHNSFNKIDSEEARFIFEALILGAFKEKVIILMDDNPSYLDHCDTIYILNKGMIVEDDHHKALLESNEFYAALFKKHDFNSVTEDKEINDQSSDANKKVSSINEDIPDTQKKANENDKTKSKKGIQEEIAADNKTGLTLDDQLYFEYLKIPRVNPSSNIEIKTPDQQDDNQEKQLDESAKEETDKKSTDDKKDEIENDFEIC